MPATAALIRAGRVAQVPFGLDPPVRPEAELAKRLVVEARANGFLRHDDNRLFESLVSERVEGDKHERAAFAGRRRGLTSVPLSRACLRPSFLGRSQSCDRPGVEIEQLFQPLGVVAEPAANV